jgi:hypothetical protein
VRHLPEAPLHRRTFFIVDEPSIYVASQQRLNTYGQFHALIAYTSTILFLIA